MYATDPADLFSQLYDALPERLFAVEDEAEAWLDDPSMAEIASEVEYEVISTGRLSEETAERFLDVVDAERNRFAVLLGLDRAFLQSDLITGTYDESALIDITLRYMETGRLNTDQVEGAVLPKLVVPGQEHLIPESLREAFTAVIRVPAESPIPIQHTLLDAWPSRTVRETGFFVSALPAFDASANLLIERVDVRPPAYRLLLIDDGTENASVESMLAALDATEGIVALLPEAALTPTRLAAWQSACVAHPRPQGSRLGWIVAGTGPEHDDPDTRPHNRAVVLERTTGRVAWEQDKQFRFPMTDDIIRRWGLTDRLGAGPLEEWITVGPALQVSEAPGFRAVVLVCEDVTELGTVGVTCAEWGVSHAFCPIFSQAIRKYRWENQHAGWLQQAAGVQTVICNSQYIGDAEPGANGEIGDVLAIGTEVELVPQRAYHDPVVVRFTEHGVFVVR